MAIEKSYIDMLKERDAKIEALKELLKLSHESLDSKDKQIAELGKRLSHAETMSDKEQSIRDLEQQAIAVYESVWFCRFEGVRTDEQPNRHISHLLNSRVKELRNQAKALKEQE
jgi:hypothetical protein